LERKKLSIIIIINHYSMYFYVCFSIIESETRQQALMSVPSHLENKQH
jgi:hypothetical protein